MDRFAGQPFQPFVRIPLAYCMPLWAHSSLPSLSLFLERLGNSCSSPHFPRDKWFPYLIPKCRHFQAKWWTIWMKMHGLYGSLACKSYKLDSVLFFPGKCLKRMMECEPPQRNCQPIDQNFDSFEHSWMLNF